MSNVIHIPPTGNANTDTANIKSAASRLTTTLSGKEPGCIILGPGDYRINESLVFGDPGTIADPYSNENPPRLIAAGTAHLTWEGGTTTDSMIVYYRPMYCPGAYLQNLMLWCEGECRGIRVQRANYGTEISGIYMRQPRQVGLDMIDCWAGTARNITIAYVNGIGARFHNFHGGTIDNLKINGENSDYPPEDEELFFDYAGSYVTSHSTRRGAMVMYGGNNQVANQLFLENADYGTDPVLSIHGSDHALFSGIYLESSEVTNERIKITGGVDDIRIRKVTAGPSSPSCACVVRMAGGSSQYSQDRVVLEDVEDNVTDGIMICDGAGLSSQSGHQVLRVSTEVGLPLDKWIVEENNPTMSGKICADSDHSVSIPWQ